MKRPPIEPRLVCAGSRDERIVVRWKEALGLVMPLVDELVDMYYRTYREVVIDVTRVGTLRDELETLRAAVETRRADDLIHERRIRARDAATRARLVAPLLEADPDVIRLRELVAICDEAIAERAPLAWTGD